MKTGACPDSCYDGPSATVSNPPCHAGTRMCGDSGLWGACLDQVVPAGEICGNTVDDNCNGTVDEDLDEDGDGYATCEGDCCDSPADGCKSPELVKPRGLRGAGPSRVGAPAGS
jgi:hypothetical protein